jgi:hypothetical protein
MEIIICILKTIAAYIILMFIGTNLIGFIVRGALGFYSKNLEPGLSTSEDNSLITSILIAISFSLISIIYFYLLFHLWNYGLLIAGILLMVLRIPDTLHEIKTGKKISLSNLPKRPIDYILSILYYLTLPLIWFSLCYL